ncbi:hypothetical protein EZV73_00320 [Acidaminobacter sp. JC074]|uniref:hypothetical protein n=1 Tax=Acidaminobacter sp. JC074 TaxID=2530199 RepID=UPI001F0D2583|nr:hypothetical protein [Acidaminobacter sp. JC074]MCH4885983.1 hypothetical protein [Acidaminobacter sp. JC074]
MYSRFSKAVSNARDYFGNSSRGKTITYLDFLTDINKYREADINEHQMISEILYEIKSIDSNQNGYHRFAYFSDILEFMGFIPDKERYDVNKDDKDFLISVIKQILNFEYQN